ncbi:MAG: efflux RND transporter periplasmic adaptor subunit [Pseudomonadota bacterium]
MLKKIENPETVETEVEEAAPEISTSGFKTVLLALTRGIFQIVLMGAILFGGFTGMNYLTALKEEPPKRPPFKTVYTVDTVIAEKGNFQPTMLVYGEVQSAKDVELRPLVSGKIVEVNPDLKIGGRINKGDVLFSIDRFSYETAMDTAKSNRDETLARIAENEARIAIEESRKKALKDQLDIARSDLDRIAQLRDRGTATAKDLEDRSLIVSQRQQSLDQSEWTLIAERARLEQMKAVLARWDRSVVQADRDLEDTVFRAPLDGIVSQNNVAVGRVVSANDLVVTMYEADRLDVRFTLTDERFGRIQADSTGVIGREVEVIWSVGGEQFKYPAMIDRLGAKITSNRGGVEVIATLSGDVNTSVLRPGAFVEVIVPDRAFEGFFKIPETALYDTDTIYAVRDGELEIRKIAIHGRSGNDIIISGNLANGDEILTTKIAEISKGLRVRTENSEPAQSVKTSSVNK